MDSAAQRRAWASHRRLLGAERRALERAEQSKAKMLVPRPPPQASARRKLTLKPSVINTNLERLQALALANNLREEEAAAWGQLREAVEDAIWAGNNAGLALLQQEAGFTRVGHHGGAAGRYADAHNFTVASFLQHDSREGDPQLHIHNGIFNRVQGPDGEWRTIDGRSLHRARPGASQGQPTAP